MFKPYFYQHLNRLIFAVLSCLVVCNVFAVNVRFCFESETNWGRPYYPKFTINGKVYYQNSEGRIYCFDIKDVQGTNVTLTTNGFDMDYRNNVITLASTYCGFSKPCIIPINNQKDELYYIHANVWPINNEKNITGVLSAVYKPTSSV